MLTRPTSFMLIATIATLARASNASADETLLLDHFDDGGLDPAWQIEFENATGWTFAEAGSELVVSDIQHDLTNDWARVLLTRPVALEGDFNLESIVGWASGDDIKVMQALIISLIDANGEIAAMVWYSDAWFDWFGSFGGTVINGGSWSTGPHSVFFDGPATFLIQRTGSELSATVAGVGSVSGTYDLPIAAVRIEFAFYPHAPGGNVISLFGVESVDMVEITVPSVNAPGDFDGDGIVGVGDLLQLLAVWGACPDCIEDLDDDGVVGTGDLLILLGLWG